MSKEVIIQRVPTDIRYVFVWKEFELSNYPKKCIIDKGIISSGLVNYCFNYNNRNMIFVESNQIERENLKMLFDDKAYLYDEYTTLKTSLEYRDFSSYLNSRIESNKPIKIITSPTDYHKVIEAISDYNEKIEDKIEFITVVNDFDQSIADREFTKELEKSDTAILSFVSNPVTDEAINMEDFYRDLPYYRLDWTGNKTLEV